MRVCISLLLPLSIFLATLSWNWLHLSDEPAASTALSGAGPTASASASRLAVSDNGRFLVKGDGAPFFWLGDTAWELVHRANRDEALAYLSNAADSGFTVVQTVILAELDGLTVPNAQGDLPLKDKNPAAPLTTAGSDPQRAAEYDYWDHLDYIVDTAGSLGLYVALLPSWGSYLWSNAGQPADPIFDNAGAAAYGKFLGERYKHKDNLVWVLGGDRIPDTGAKKDIVRHMASGLNEGGGTQIKTYHPWGGKSSSEYFHDEPWLAFNSLQSGHPYRDYPNYSLVGNDYAKAPIKPVFDIEPRYEHLPIDFNPGNGRFDGYDARQAAYWSVFAGSFGHTYGHNSIWQLYAPHREAKIHASVPWTEALAAEGRSSLRWLRTLIESRPMPARVPDQSLIADPLKDGNRIAATRGDDYAFIYSSKGHPFTVNMGKIAGTKIAASWYDPRTGETTAIAEYPNAGTRSFAPPSSGTGHDWVLVLDDAASRYAHP